jgi:DNA-binding winged helix-turn-helix (wHTH) protein
MASVVRNRTFQFGSFELDQCSGELRKNGIRLKLQDQPFQILTFLLEHPGELISREEIRRRLWPDNTFVDFDNAISSAVWKVREALGDNSGNPRFVQTVARRGYRFVSPVSTQDQTTAVALITERQNLACPPASAGVPERIEQKNAQSNTSLIQARPRLILLAAVGLLSLIIAGLFWFHSFKNSSSPLPEPQTVPLSSLPGIENFPAFSPDGKQVAYAWGDAEDGIRDSIYVKLIGSDTQLRLTSSPGFDGFPHWSPDGRYIAFCREAPGATGDYIVSALGGPARQITTLDSCGNLDWLPDGQHLVVSQLIAARSWTGGKIYPLLTVPIETGKQQTLTKPSAGTLGDASPLVSPDGKTLAFVRLLASEAADVYLMPVGPGRPRRLTFDGQAKRGIAWTSDGREVVVATRRGGTFRLGAFRSQVVSRAPSPLAARTATAPRSHAKGIGLPTLSPGLTSISGV